MRIQENNEGAHFSKPIRIPSPIITADNARETIVKNSISFAIL